MGWYIVIKTIKGYRYRYRQRTWREGKRVRTESVYLGPAGSAPGPYGKNDGADGKGPQTFKVYRGIDATRQSNDHGVAGKGEYWSGRRSVAEAYARRDGRVLEGTITLYNPYVATYGELNALQRSLYGKTVSGFDAALSDNFDAYLRAHGYDGVVLFDLEMSTTIPEEVIKLSPLKRVVKRVKGPVARLRLANTTLVARDVPAVDAVAEKALIDRIFSVSGISGRWHRPWIGGRYTAKAKWMPDQRLYALSKKIGVVGKSSPFGGLVDRGWRKKRYDIKAAYSSRNVLEMPDHTRFLSNAHGTAEQNFAHTFLHEMAHATGRKPECKRAIWNRFGGAAYAREELVADLTAHIMAHRLGLAPPSIAGVTWYVNNWLGAIRYENQAAALAYAEVEALRAADYLTKLWGELPASS